MADTRRRSLALLGAGALLIPAACARPAGAQTGKAAGAAEDLMLEHGVLRRAVAIYEQLGGRLIAGDVRFDPRALADTAQLFRDFGEDFHERMLEEALVFPRVARAGGEAAVQVVALQAQHERGREITDYVLAQSRAGRIADPEALGRTLRSMAVMYESHAAREDAIVFPAWKTALSEAGYREAGLEFADIERKLFGRDGLADADRRMDVIEKKLGLDDLSRFTAPPPPPAA